MWPNLQFHAENTKFYFYMIIRLRLEKAIFKLIDELKKKVITQCIEYQQDSMNGKWESFGATERTKECLEQLD